MKTKAFGKIVIKLRRAALASLLVFNFSHPLINVAARAKEMQVGACANLHMANINEINDAIEKAAALNLKVLRWDAPWAMVEKVKGTLSVPPLWDYIVNQSTEKGIKSILILDYGNKFYDQGDKPQSLPAISAFANYSKFIASHFAGRVAYYEVWNEWNSTIGGGEHGTVEGYRSLVKAVYPAIKAADNNAKVIVGAFVYRPRFGSDPEFNALLNTDIWTNSDAISIHAYTVYEKDNTFRHFEAKIAPLLAQIRQTPLLISKPIFITEAGWTTSSGSNFGVSEALQREYLGEAMKFASREGVAAFMIYKLKDGSALASDPESGFGIFKFDGTCKLVCKEISRDE